MKSFIWGGIYAHEMSLLHNELSFQRKHSKFFICVPAILLGLLSHSLKNALCLALLAESQMSFSFIESRVGCKGWLLKHPSHVSSKHPTVAVGLRDFTDWWKIWEHQWLLTTQGIIDQNCYLEQHYKMMCLNKYEPSEVPMKLHYTATWNTAALALLSGSRQMLLRTQT